ncbi:MAG: hypothetical protein ABIP14_03555 [Blastocatellia bacterium]
MELPILQDNLRSSGGWTAALASEQEQWAKARAASTAIESKLREIQVEQILKTCGGQIDPARLLEAASKISAWATEANAAFNAARLLALHRTLIGAAPIGPDGEEVDVLRKGEPTPINAAHDPTPARLLPQMIDHAFDWFSTESFGELHPVEQATVVYLRLLDLYPFPILTEPTAILAAGFYTERAGLPPLVIFAQDPTQAEFAQTLEAAMRMLTQPLIELFARMLLRAMRQSAVPSTVATG